MGIGKGIFGMALRKWGLTPEEARRLVGEIGDEWAEAQIETAELVNEIYLNLRFMPPALAHAWPRTPNDNPLFGGRAPLDLMLTGTRGLETVLRFLKAQNGGPL
jgi:hypothetical protein